MIVKESDVILTRLESSQARVIGHFIFNFLQNSGKPQVDCSNAGFNPICGLVTIG